MKYTTACLDGWRKATQAPWGASLFLLALLLLGQGCASRETQAIRVPGRPFQFHADKLAFTNETVWKYQFQPDGSRKVVRRNPGPEYSLHCFVMSITTRSFFYHAAFDPTEPRETPERYQQLVDEILDRNPREVSRDPVIIPGYANLYEFSKDYEKLIKDEAGGAWQSYFQRGNWRMIFPFSRKHQEETVAELSRKLSQNFLPVAHLARFPSLAINHAVLLYEAEELPETIVFRFFEPNDPLTPGVLVYHRAKREFSMDRNSYFAGGRVDVYEVYKNLIY
ncbi:MAG: hypothetical protein ACO1QB_08365 [Verrucomicrobiales bacterium]